MIYRMYIDFSFVIPIENLIKNIFSNNRALSGVVFEIINKMKFFAEWRYKYIIDCFTFQSIFLIIK